MIVVKQNAHQVTQMTAMAERLGLPHHVFSNISPTIYGGPESLPAQSVEHLRKRKVFTGCNAGHTFFHVDPHGRASICKVGRDPQIDLIAEGIEGLARLGRDLRSGVLEERVKEAYRQSLAEGHGAVFACWP